MKSLYIIGSIIIVGSLLTGYTITKADDDSKTSLKKSVNKEVDEKVWKDVTKLEKDMKYDFPTNVQDYIASEEIQFNLEPNKDSKIIQSGHDKYYYYYLESMGMQNVLSVIQVKGISMEKDFKNLKQLNKIIIEEEQKRSDHIPINKYDKRDPKQIRQELAEKKKPSERMIKAIAYTKQLLHDLDIVVNKKGNGDTFGVSYQADGTKIKTMEDFIKLDKK